MGIERTEVSIVPMRSLGVSLVLYENAPAAVRGVLESLRATPGEMHICVVDNSPTDGLRDTVTAFGVRYVHEPSNPGFGASHNRALTELPPTHFHLVLNPDITFPERSLLSLMESLSAEPDVGIASPRVLFPNGELQYVCKRYPTVLVLFARRFLPRRLHFLIRRKLDEFEMRDVGYERPMDVPHATGCFMLFRRAALEAVTGFDPKFFMYFEDADISFRIARLGYRVRYYPEAHVFHHWSRASHQSWRMTLVSIRSSLYLFSKHGWRFL